MQLKRAPLAVLTLAAACLDPGAPVLSPRDVDPPVVKRMVPDFTPGTVQTISRDTEIEIEFNEPMELRSLRPGISVVRNREPVALTVAAANVDPRLETDFAVTARPTPGTLADGGTDPDGGRWLPNVTYTLTLNTLLTDTEGNALAGDVTVRFQAAP